MLVIGMKVTFVRMGGKSDYLRKTVLQEKCKPAAIQSDIRIQCKKKSKWACPVPFKFFPFIAILKRSKYRLVCFRLSHK